MLLALWSRSLGTAGVVVLESAVLLALWSWSLGAAGVVVLESGHGEISLRCCWRCCPGCARLPFQIIIIGIVGLAHFCGVTPDDTLSFNFIFNILGCLKSSVSIIKNNETCLLNSSDS